MDENSIDYDVCIICKKKKSEQLVENPSSHDKVLKFIEEWASYGDIRYFDLWAKLKSVPIEEVKRSASWHRSCYQDTVHTNKLKRAKER